MRGTKKRMMYKKRKVGRRRFTRKMRMKGGLTPAENNYNRYSNDEFKKVFNDWKANRQEENKKSSYKNISRGFRERMFNSETDENLKKKFLASDEGKHFTEEMTTMQNTIKKGLVITRIEKQIKLIKEKINEKEQNLNKLNEEIFNNQRSNFYDPNLINKKKDEESTISELSIILSKKEKYLKKITTPNKIMLDRNAKFTEVQENEIDNNDIDENESEIVDEDEVTLGGKRRRRTKRRKH